MAASEKAEAAGNQGYEKNHMDAIFEKGFSFSGYERDMLQLNLGNKKYMDVSGVSGLDSITDARGSLFADFDNDGDADVLMISLQGDTHHLFRNEVGSRSGFVRVALEGKASGRDAYGAVVRVKTSAGTLTKVKAGGSGYLSHSDARLLFGLGPDKAAEWVEVTWPGGAKQRFGPVASGSSIRIVEGATAPAAVNEKRFRLPAPLSKEDALLAKLSIKKGDAFPSLKLKGTDGKETTVAALRKPGRRLLVNLWATYCVPCAKEMPELEKLSRGLAGSGVDLVGLSIDMDTADQVPGYLAQRRITYPIFTTDEASVKRLFPGEQVLVPITFLLDGQGRLQRVFAGWTPESRREFETLAAKP